MNSETHTDFESSIHDFRKQIDACIKVAESYLAIPQPSKYGREMALVRTELQDAKMWLGKVLEAVGAPFPPELRDEAE